MLLLGLGGTNYLLRGRGPFGRLVGAKVVLALAIFVVTGFLTSLPPATAVSREATPRGPSKSSRSGWTPWATPSRATPRSSGRGGGAGTHPRGLSGLPKKGKYFGEIHGGVCENGQQGGDPGVGYVEAGRPLKSEVRLELLSSGSPEYAHGGAHEDADVSLRGSGDGTGLVVTPVRDYDTIEELLSGGPRYLDLHAPAPGDPSIACGEIG